MRKHVRRAFVWSPFILFMVYVFNFQPAKSSSGTSPAGAVQDPVINSTCARSGCHDTYSPFTTSRADVTIGTTSGNQVPLNGFQYAGNTQYIINFSVIAPTNRSGFSMSALTPTNTSAGTFARTNTTNTTLQTASTIQYIGHRNANSTSSWSFNWTSPATTTGNITFYSAVNKSNSSNSDSGDSIFHQTFVISPAAVALTVDAGNNVSVCPNTTTQLQAVASNTSGTTYAWSPGTGLSCTTCANPIATPGSTTVYTVTATNGAQTATDNVTVATFTTTVPTITSAANLVCPGSSLSLSSTGFSSYVWSTGSNTATATVNTGGTYTLTVTDANGCSTTASKAIQPGQTPAPVIASTRPFLCGNNSTVLSVGSFSTYQWSNNATTATTTVSQTGNYTVTVTNATGCSATATYNLTGYALPVANVTASGPLTFCSGGSVVLTANSGTGYTYKWSTGATTAGITVSQSGAYGVTVYNPCDSAVSQTQNVVVNAVPVAQLSPAGSILLCNGISQTLHASPTGLSYAWLKDGSVLSGQQTDSLVVNAAGSYAVVVSQGICSDTSLPVSVSTSGAGNAAVDITATQTQLCAGDVVTLDAGAGFTSYSWLPGNSTSQTLQVTTAGTYIVNVTASNGQCTSSGADTLVITDGLPVTVPVLSYDSATCSGDSITVLTSPSSYTSYSWSNGATTASAVGPTGVYSVTVTNNGFCGTATATIDAAGVALPDAGFTAVNALLTANTTGATYQWYLDNATIDNATANTYTVLQTGSYTLQVTVNGCSSTSAPQQITISGVEDIKNDIGFMVYPNPVNDVVKIKCNTVIPVHMELSLQSLEGRAMQPTKHIGLNAGENALHHDLQALAPGIYLMQVKVDGVSTNIKIVKQ